MFPSTSVPLLSFSFPYLPDSVQESLQESLQDAVRLSLRVFKRGMRKNGKCERADALVGSGLQPSEQILDFVGGEGVQEAFGHGGY